MTSYVDIDEDIDTGFDVNELADKLMDKVTGAEGCPYETCINLRVTHSEDIREYNRDFREIDSVTDVLSFPALDIENGDFESVDENDLSLFDPDSGELMLGDIMINYDRVISQAEEYGHSILREFAFLLTHSLFHLCGYDHMDEASAQLMEEKQESVLKELGITRN